MNQKDDLISRQDAIRIVDGIDTWQAGWRGDAIESIKALPSAQPEKRTHEKRTETHACDCISRRAAIDALDAQIGYCDHALKSLDISTKDEYAIKVERASLIAYRETLECLPSAQPEIIRCKDCKHRDPEDRKCDCGHDILWQLPRQDEWYCADAERKTDG